MFLELNLDERGPSTEDVERRRCQALSLAIEHHGNWGKIPSNDVVLATAKGFLAFITTGESSSEGRGSIGASLHAIPAGDKRQ